MLDQKIEQAPEASRPWMPKEYGIKTTEEGMLTWEHVNDVLKGALNYWIATTSQDGRPHVRPVWGAWVDNILYFDGHPATGWGRNINRDPRISVQVEVGEDAIIIEGVVVDVPQAPADLAERLAQEFDAKYKSRYNYTTDPEPFKVRGLLLMRPHKILAWDVTEFTSSPTKWTFDTDGK